MKKTIFAFLLAACLTASLTACGQPASPSAASPSAAPESSASDSAQPEAPAVGEKAKAPMMALEDIDPNGGADGVQGTYDHADSKYFVNPDFYNMKSDDQVTIIEQYQTSQQTSEWSCGVNAGLMALNHFGVNKYTEMDIAKLMKANTDMDVEGALPGTANSWNEPGSDVKRMMDFMNQCPELKVVETNFLPEYTEADLVNDEDVASLVYSPGMKGNFRKTFSSSSLYTSDNDPASTNYVSDAKDSYFVKWITGHLSAGRPILTHTSAWNGHWSTLIGYDNMGTPTIGDDMLIFADSYDLSDHWQDGYTYMGLEKFFYEWDDLNIAPKPYQLQPFVVVEKAA